MIPEGRFPREAEDFEASWIAACLNKDSDVTVRKTAKKKLVSYFVLREVRIMTLSFVLNRKG